MASSMQQVADPKSSTCPHPLRHIRELDGVRGLAALMVFFHHVCYTSIQPGSWGRSVRLLRTISTRGDTGVDLFFVLSGFLITSLLIDARKRPSYYRDFYWKRVLRILPLYALCLLGAFFFNPGSKGYVILCVFFISNFASVFHLNAIGPFWTLAIEEQFYLLWPTVVRRRSIPQLRHWALAVGLSAVVLRFIGAAFGRHNYQLTFFRCDGLACGALLACWFYQRDPDTANRAREALVISVILLAGIVFITLSMLSSTSPRIDAALAALNQTGVTFLCGAIIAFFIRHSGTLGVAWLRSPVLTFFGLISYAMYMIHAYVMLTYDHFRGQLPPGDNAAYLVRFSSILGITLVLCLLSRYLIEVPAVSLRKHVLART